MTVAIAGSIAFVLALAGGRPVILGLRRLAYRQQAYEDAPQTHQKKSGTPTMGGLLFLLAPLVALAFVRNAEMAALCVLIVGSGAIGFIDDLSAIRRGRNRGLRARTKFLATALVGAVALALLAQTPVAQVPLLFVGVLPSVWWWVLSLCVILATTHAVNLTDGLDGLASGTLVPPLLLLTLAAGWLGDGAAGVLGATVLGSVLGFLAYNRHPAQMFMGDTGSLALGGALAGMAIVSGLQLLLPLIGGVFAAETLSVILQVASFKTTGKRIFRMSPLHHHFELAGWPETKVTTRFWAASALLTAVGAGVLRR